MGGEGRGVGGDDLVLSGWVGAGESSSRLWVVLIFDLKCVVRGEKVDFFGCKIVTHMVLLTMWDVCGPV